MQPDFEQINIEMAAFRAKLNALRQTLSVDFPWYPYDILASLRHLEPLITPELLALFGPGKRIADIGAADGDLSFFLETRGNQCHIYDNPPTNMNGLRGAALLKTVLESRTTVTAMDVDTQFAIPNGYDLVVLLGILYHLKNPFYVLEKLASVSRYMLISTRITRCFTTGGPDVSSLPVCYLVGPKEMNADATNYWIFTEAGLKRLIDRAGWEIIGFRTLGDTVASTPSDNAHDERAFAVLRSRAI